jgi:hypothetical protein
MVSKWNNNIDKEHDRLIQTEYITGGITVKQQYVTMSSEEKAEFLKQL